MMNTLQKAGLTGGGFGAKTRAFLGQQMAGLNGRNNPNNPAAMWVPGGKDGKGSMKLVSDMTDDEFRMAKFTEKTFGRSAFKDNLLPSEGGSGEKTRMAKFRERSVRNRTKMDSYRGRQVRSAMNSAGAKMGTSIALSFAAQHASPEAQGALALGGAVSQINPLAGIAVAGLGTAMTSKTVAGGGVSGALGGAAAGAMIGSIIPGVGTAVGAIVGGIVGGLGGMVMGHLNKVWARQKASRAAADKLVGKIVNTGLSSTWTKVTEEMKRGGTGPTSLRNTFDFQKSKLERLKSFNPLDANGNLRMTGKEMVEGYRNRGYSISKKDEQDILKEPEIFAKKVQSEASTQLNAGNLIQGRFNKVMDSLGKMTGKTDNQLLELASTMGVNLMDPTLDFTDAVEKLGLTMVKTKEQLDAATTSAVVDTTTIFDKAIKKQQTPHILDEEARTFRDKVDAGGVSTEDKLQFLKSILEKNTELYGSGGVGQAQFEQSFLGPNATAFKIGPLAGLRDLIQGDPEVMRVLTEQQTQGRQKLGAEYATGLNAKLAQTGRGIDANKFQEIVNKMTPAQLVKLNRFAASGYSLGEGKAGQDAVDKAGSYEKAVAQAIGLDNLDIKNSVLDPQLAAAKSMDEATKKLVEQMDDFFKRDKEQKPDWFTKEAFDELIHDTSTPRASRIGDTTSSKLAMTMGRHSAMDAALTGKRTVTSGYRTYGLGSINSDHATGRAYDLVGQNLGQYQTMAKAGGGFAEFHGTGGDRHLHVVPGPGAIGDRRTPIASSNKLPTIVSSGSSGDVNYSFYIEGGPSASPEEIAKKVMMKIKETERSNKERM